MRDPDRDRRLQRQGRIAALVIAVSGLAAIFAPLLVQVAGLPVRFEFLIYLLALAGFAWALIVTFQIWRARQDN
ncbi:DUF5337 domain-containing protein [Alkalilacustris brevis]|uniref:DUF5337 domain-containing protein n=1 Tax=Alkalilacustris brevis TaxID=2026338 RepID=UPI000E0D57FD|nr:DUF5337 domain-containing protein [Alkalilacustris brevis]